jgi:L-fuculose-phosphate aldolase
LNKGEHLRKRIVQVAKKLFQENLTHGSSGNISARIPDTNTCLIKPSGYCLGALEPKDLIAIDIYTMEHSGSRNPSIETPFHTKIYRKYPKVGGVVHLHSKYSTILSILEIKPIPTGIDILSCPKLIEGIALTKFALPGTEELANNICNSLKNRVACLLPHHGSLTIGDDIEEAARYARELERLAELNYLMMLIGEPKPLPEQIISKMKKSRTEKFNPCV